MDWTEPGPEEVAPGVHRIPLPLPMDGLKAVNVYAILGDETNTLIDGGWKIDIAREALDKALSELGLAVADFDRCLVTHHHRDHYTMATDLRRRAGLSVALGEGEKPNIEGIALPRQAFHAQRPLLRAAGAAPVAAAIESLFPEAVDSTDFGPPDVWLRDQQELDLGDRTLRIRATPGHTMGHVVFMDDEAELLLAGDHILPHITPSIGFETVLAASPLADYLASLALILNEPDRLLLPAHGPAGGSTHVRAQELLAHHDRRLAQTLAAVHAGAGTAYEVAHVLRWTSRDRSLAELDTFNQMLAVSETVAHLDVLATQGQIRKRDESGVWVYSR